MNGTSHYYAFISHSSADEKTALWLRRQLENYRVPSSVRAQLGVPERLRPIFLYQTDLAGNNLHEALLDSLDESQFLIVLCSPSACQSKFVNAEVQHFIDTGRTNAIIPIIIAGTPYAEQNGLPAKEECFPEAIRRLKGTPHELRGIPLSLNNGRVAVMNIIATMLGVRFDVLWNRYEQQRRKFRRIGAVSLILTALITFCAWEYLRPSYRYFADYVDRWGIPEGIVEMSKERCRHANRMYEFRYERIPIGEKKALSWRVVEVRYINSAGILRPVTDTELKDRASIQRIIYYTSDIPRQVYYCNEKDSILLRKNLFARNGVPATIADFAHAEEQQGVGHMGSDLNSMIKGTMEQADDPSNIVRFVYQRNARGFITAITFHSSNSEDLQASATPDQDGIFGQQFELDSLGRRIGVQYMDAAQQVITTRHGVAKRTFTYDPWGNIQVSTYLGLDGRPTLNELYFATCVGQTDAYGNITEEVYLDTLGQLTMIQGGFARRTAKTDEHGNAIEIAYWDTEEHLCMNSYGYARETMEYDRKGRVIHHHYFDTENNPINLQ